MGAFAKLPQPKTKAKIWIQGIKIWKQNIILEDLESWGTKKFVISIVEENI